MEITLIGYILIPLGILLFIFSTRYLFYAFVFFIPFSASAVINVPSITFGLQIPYYFGILFMVKRTLDYLLEKRVLISRGSKILLIFLSLFLVVAFASLIMPFIIDGKINAYGAQGIFGFAPVKLSVFNVTQFLYLLFGVILTFFIVFEIKNWETFVNSIKVYLISAFLVCMWGLQQPVEHYLGISYPAFLFNNSMSSAALGFGQIIGTVKRISSVAVEPSIFSRYLLSVLSLAAVATIRKSELFKNKLILPSFTFFFVLVIFSTTSTTAYMGLAFLVAVLFSRYLNLKRTSFRLFFFILIITVIITMLMLFFYFKYPLLISEFFNSLRQMTVGKMTTFSGLQRFNACRDAISVFTNYPILGIGWGSTASHDMISKLLSNTGIIGFFSFLLLIFFMRKLFRKTYKTIQDSETKILAEGIGISLLVVLFTNVMAGFDFVFLHLWFLFGMIICLPNIVSHKIPQKDLRKGGKETDGFKK